LVNEFGPAPCGVAHLTRMTIGGTTPSARLILNRIARHNAVPATADRAAAHE
jgi:hypothetical protein